MIKSPLVPWSHKITYIVNVEYPIEEEVVRLFQLICTEDVESDVIATFEGAY